MARSSEEISRNNTSGGKPDTNLANDSLHLGGIPADEFATEKYVQNYHGAKEAIQKQYIDNQDSQKLQEAKNYTDTVVANQDFSSFAKVTDVQTLNRNLNNKIDYEINQLSNQTEQRIQGVVNDVNQMNEATQTQINNINTNIDTLRRNDSSKD